MIKAAYCNVENLDLKKAYALVSKNRREKIDFYRFDRDKRLSAGAYLLLRKMLDDENIKNPIFKTGRYGKPYLSNYENTYFSLSHSDNLVVCAISDDEIGADVEHVNPEIDLDIAKRYFFNSEYENIMNSENPTEEFFEYWVLKESYMKYTGLGMNLKLDSFEITIKDKISLKENNENIKFSLFNIENYKISIVGNHEVSELHEYDIAEIV